MSAWLQWILGFRSADLPQGAEAEFVWLHPPGPWTAWLILLVLFVCIGLVFVMYRRESAACPLWLRRGLAVGRSLVLVVLALIYFGPALVWVEREVIEPVILVLVDDSASMGITDLSPASAQPAAQDEQPRYQRVRQVMMEGETPLLARLDELGQVQVYGFGEQLSQAFSWRDDWPLAGEGTATDVTSAIREAMRQAGNRPVAAVVLVTDGQVTAGDDPRPLAGQLGLEGVPLLVLGAGQEQTIRPWRVTELWARETVWRGDPFTLEARLVGSDASGNSVTVEWWEKPLNQEEAPERSIARQVVPLEQGKQTLTLTHEHAAAEVGRYSYSLRIVQAEDASADENRASLDHDTPVAMVDVVEDQARVLLVSGRPGWDFQAVKNLLLRERSVKLSVWLQSLDANLAQEGTLRIDALPATAETLFPYDLVILMDPVFQATASAQDMAIQTTWLELLKELVGQQGGGLLFVPGPVYTAGWIQQPGASALRSMLPVNFTLDQALDLEGLVRPPTRAWPMRFTPEAADHPVLRQSSTGQGSSATGAAGMEQASGVYWSFPAQAGKPGSRTLLEHGDPWLRNKEGLRPLLVSGQYGPGRTLYLGLDSTWRWRRLGHDSEFFDRFWLQAVRYLVEGRRVSSARRGSILLDTERLTVGSTLNLSARLFDAAYAPLLEPTVKAELHIPGELPTAIQMRSVPQRPGQYEATTRLRKPGAHELVIDLGMDARGQPVRLTRRFQVERPRIEFADTRLNRPLLETLARQSGGQYLPLEQAAGLAQWVPDRTQVRLIPSPPQSLWDHWLTMVLLTFVLSIEWWIRKQKRLM